MSLVFRFNKYILVPTLIEWLVPTDFLTFDSALCNHADREYFLTILENYSVSFKRFIFSTLESISLSVSLFNWITQRLKNFGSINEYVSLMVSNVSLKTFRLGLDPVSREKLLTFFSMVKRLEINRCTGVNQKYVAEEFLVTCNTAEEVIIVDTEWSHFVDQILTSVGNNLRHLRVFNLDGCRHCSESVVISVIRNCPLLTELGVRDLEYIKDGFMKALIVHGRNIKKLIATKCIRLSHRPFMMFFLHNIGISLEGISFPEKSIDSGRHRVEMDLSVCAMMWYRGSKLKLLEAIVGWQSLVTNTEEICDACPDIVSLKLSYLFPLPDSTIITLFDKWNKFVRLELPHLPCVKFRFIIQQIFAKCLHLQEFRGFQGSPSTPSTPVEIEVDLNSFNCSELTILEIAGNIKTEEYAGLLGQSRNFRTLKINQPQYGLTVPTVSEGVAVSVGPCFSQLEEFWYPQCPSQECFESLIRHSTKLKHLTVPTKCYFPFDDAIDRESVTRLVLENRKLEDLPGEELFIRCPRLDFLKIHAPIGLPYAASLVERLPYLKELQTHAKVPKTHRIFKVNKNLTVCSVK